MKNIATALSVHISMRNKHWILDSGASMHFTPLRDAFTTYHKFSKKECPPVQMAASTIFVEGKGTIETTQMVTSVNWYSRESRNWRRTESASSWLRRWSHWLVWGKTKRTKLEFSGWDLRPYILLHVYVHICTGSTDDCSRTFRCLVAWGGSVHQAWPRYGSEVKHKATTRQWQNGREERKDIAMHCTEMNEARCACGIMWREKGSIETAWLS